MFTINPNTEIRSGDVIDGRLVQYVAISTLPQLMSAIWALLLVLSIQYGINILCSLNNFSVYDAARTFTIDFLISNNTTKDYMLILALCPYGHYSSLHFALEIINLVFLFVHISNVLGQLTTLVVTIFTPYFAVFFLIVLGEPSLAIGTSSASAALLTVAIVAHSRQLFTLGRAQKLVSFGLLFAYLSISPFGTVVPLMAGFAIGVLVSYICKINDRIKGQLVSRSLIAVTYYYVPTRLVLLAFPSTLLLMIGAIVFGAN